MPLIKLKYFTVRLIPCLALHKPCKGFAKAAMCFRENGGKWFMRSALFFSTARAYNHPEHFFRQLRWKDNYGLIAKLCHHSSASASLRLHLWNSLSTAKFTRANNSSLLLCKHRIRNCSMILAKVSWKTSLEFSLWEKLCSSIDLDWLPLCIWSHSNDFDKISAWN